MCYYDIDDTGFYDEFGNPIDPSQMDDYLMYGGTDFTVDPEQLQGYGAATAAGRILGRG